MPHAPIVEMDWTNTNSWTNVTRWVRDESGINITRGRGDEQSEINAGTMGLTFHNMDGRFTPLNAASPYYPNVRKQRPIRCRVIAWVGNMLTNSSFETGTTLNTNPGFETTGTGWAATSGATYARSNAQAYRGSWSGLLTTGAAANPKVEATSSATVPVTAGQQYRASGWLYAAQALPAGAGVHVNWLDANGVYMSTSNNYRAPGVGVWELWDTTFTAPPGAAKAGLVFSCAGTPGAGLLLYGDELRLDTVTGATGLEDWSAAGSVLPTLATSTTHVQDGTQALRVTWGTGGTGPAAQTTVYGLEVGLVYTASAYVYVPSGGAPAVRLGVAGLSTGSASSTPNAFQRISYTWTATDTYAVLQVTPTTSPTSGQQVWVDAAQVVAGSSPTTYGGSDASISTRFVGRVNEWPQSYEEGDALVLTDVTCTDVMMRFGNLDPMRSLLEEEMLFLGPDAYYTLGEASGATSAGDTSGGAQQAMSIYQVAGAGGTVAFGEADGPGTDDLPAARFSPFSATQGKGLMASVREATGNIVLACWVSTTTGGRDFLQIANRYADDGGSGTAFVMNVNASGKLQVVAFNSDFLSIGTFDAATGFGSVDLLDGRNHLVAVQVKSDGGVFANIDGEDGTAGFAFGTLVATDLYNRIVAGGFVNPNGGSPNVFDGVLSHVWYNRMPSMPDWSFVWSAGNGNTESTTDRFTRLAGLLQFPATILGSSTTQIDSQVAGGQAPMEALRTIAAVEAGLVYPDRVSGFTFECRNYRYNASSSLTLTGSDISDDLSWSDDDQYLVNDATFQRVGGADQRVINQPSKTEYGTYTPGGNTSLPWTSDDDALAAAEWAVYKGADPPPRLNRVTLDANRLSNYSTVLTLDISHVITVTDLPDTSPYTTVDLHIEGYSENISMVLHTISFNTSPAAPNDVWQLGVAGRSELGSTTRFGL